MTDNHKPQYVTLDDPRISALFVQMDDGATKVFYDLDALVTSLAETIMPGVLNAYATGNEDEQRFFAGVQWTVESLVQSRDALTLDAMFMQPAADR